MLPDHIHAVACLVGLLRAGEQSAEQAFGRIAGRLSATQFAHALPSLRAIAADEARHDRLLARAAGAIDGEWFGLRPGVQRFFMRLESRDPRIHLSRIASLDGAVCQLLSAVLSKGFGTAHTTLPHPVLATLVTIRADEGRHVRIARALARELGQDAASFRAFDLETRHRFSDVLGHFDRALATLGLDTVALRRRIRRDEQ
jgi:hypothetical protein